jgi:hypothetical protein
MRMSGLVEFPIPGTGVVVRTRAFTPSSAATPSWHTADPHAVQMSIAPQSEPHDQAHREPLATVEIGTTTVVLIVAGTTRLYLRWRRR